MAGGGHKTNLANAYHSQAPATPDCRLVSCRLDQLFLTAVCTSSLQDVADQSLQALRGVATSCPAGPVPLRPLCQQETTQYSSYQQIQYHSGLCVNKRPLSIVRTGRSSTTPASVSTRDHAYLLAASVTTVKANVSKFN